MYILENRYTGNRLGISVSKKVGNSVVRHRVTRLIREIYRLNETIFKTGLDIVVIARPAAKESSFHDSPMRNSSKSCLKRKLLKRIMRQTSEKKRAKHRSEILPIIGFRLISAWIYANMGLGEAK
jgi:RNase P protein component